MSNEVLIVVDSNVPEASAAIKNSTKAMALAFAGLDSTLDLAKQYGIVNIYNSIYSGHDIILGEGEINRIYKDSIKTPVNTLIFQGYQGTDSIANAVLSSITLLGGNGDQAYESLKCSINATFCSCGINRLSVAQTRDFISDVFSFYAKTYPYASTQLTDAIFSDNQIALILSQDFTAVIEAINEVSPKDNEVETHYYPFYDTQKIFSEQIDYQKMGDAEAQYYYVSGKITFDDELQSDIPCINSIKTGSDGSTYLYYENLPCYDPGSSVAPVNHLSFYRVFPDAPQVTGAELLDNVFDEFNRAAHPILNNYITGLYSEPSLTLKYCNLESDLRFFDAISKIETGQVPQPPNLTSYSSSHIGGSNTRWRITGYYCENNRCTPLYAEVPMTGFKIIPISLDEAVWGNEYNSLRTNPEAPLASKLIRALNIQNHLSSGNVGGPIIGSNSFELPCLYISEELYNKTVGTFQTGDIYIGTFKDFAVEDGALRPLILGQKVASVGISGASYNAGDTGNFPKIQFSFSISNTGFSGAYANEASKCLGMGDGGGDFTVSGERSGNNAGYAYRDFSILSGGVVVSSDLFYQYAGSGIIGRQESPIISYIDGFTSKLPASTERLYAYNNTGGLTVYNYFQPGNYNGIEIPLTGWSEPFPIPSGGLTPIIKSQRRENHHPRYGQGPYSSKFTPFLYPSASGVNLAYSGAFPLEVTVNLSVSEEIARVYYQKRTLQYINGAIKDTAGVYINNPYLKNDGTWKTSFTYALKSNPDPAPTEIVIPSTTSLVPDYWADIDFIEYYNGSSAIHDLLSGPCSGQATGKVGSSIVMSITSGISLSGNYASGHYVIEYETGYYSHVPSSPNIYRVQEDSDSVGLFVIHSNGSGRQTLFELDNSDYYQGTFSTPPTFYSNPHSSFYHSGGAIVFSGAFPPLQYSAVVPLKIRLEKDCDLCDAYYQKYDPYLYNKNRAGCKYIQNNNCLFFNVYPSGMTSYDNQKWSSAPIFKQGARLNFEAHATCSYSSVPVYELVRKGAGANAKYAPLSGYDINTEFYISSSKNRTITLKYTLPAYSVSDRMRHPEYADGSLIWPNVPTCTDNVSGAPAGLIGASQVSRLHYRNNELIPSGADPIWFEVVGGNSGVSGGYHSRGLIGDAWMGLSADNYGISIEGCPSPTYYVRYPENDDFVLELNYRPKHELSLHTRALKYTPGHFASSPIYSSASGFERFDLNGIEKRHSIPNSSYLLYQIVNSFVSTGFQEYSYESDDYLFPIPNSHPILSCPLFSSLAKYEDPYNSGEYKSSGVINYWKKVLSMAENTGFKQIITGYRYRDKSRMNFRVNSIVINARGPQPVDFDQQFRLTGQCSISGEFGYHSQAESAVFTEGVFLKDQTPDYPLNEFYTPSFVSDVLLRLPLVESGSPTSPIDAAPSRCLTRKNISKILPSGNIYIPHLTSEPYNYNKFIVPAISDLSYLNYDREFVGLEKVLVDDGVIFPNSTFLLSASVSQHTGTQYEDFMEIPNAPKLYYVQDIKQFYDSSVTDAALNPNYFIGSGRGPKVKLEQATDSSGFSAPKDAKYSLFNLGVYESSGYDDYQLPEEDAEY